MKYDHVLLANVVDALSYAFATLCRDLNCFTRTDARRRIPICLAETHSFASAWPRRPVPSPWLPAAGPPSRGPAAPSPGLTSDGSGSKGHGALWIDKVPVVDYEPDGDLAP